MVDESGKESVNTVKERLASAIVKRNELPKTAGMSFQ
jgi:hypothetical protein